MDHSYPYIASLTREPFLFYEMRSTAKLMAEGKSDGTIVKEIVSQNLFLVLVRVLYLVLLVMHLRRLLHIILRH